MEVTLNENLINMPPNSENCVEVYLVTQTMRSLKSNYLQMAMQSVMLRGAYGFKCEYINGAGGCAYYIFWYMLCYREAILTLSVWRMLDSYNFKLHVI